SYWYFFFQAEDGIRDRNVTGVQTCALPIYQTVTFIRNATVDEVTGNVTYGSWSENGKHTFATVNVPTVPGYTATGDVSSLTVTPDSKDTNVTINYTANEQSTQIVFVDKDGKAIDTVNVDRKSTRLNSRHVSNEYAV